MSNKFTAITSGGVEIPVYDKAAQSAISGLRWWTKATPKWPIVSDDEITDGLWLMTDSTQFSSDYSVGLKLNYTTAAKSPVAVSALSATSGTLQTNIDGVKIGLKGGNDSAYASAGYPTLISLHDDLSAKMSTALLEFNSENKISGYNGSAFASGSSESNVSVYTDASLPTNTQLDTDIAANKAICIIYDGRNYWYDRQSDNWYYFYGADAYSNYLYYLSFDGSKWRRGQQVLAKISDLTGKMNVSDLEYNTDNQITAYNGSAFAGGSSSVTTTSPISGDGTSDSPIGLNDGANLPVGSLALSAGDGISMSTDVDTAATTLAVSVNAMPISAGEGVDINVVDGTLVISAKCTSDDETTLFEGWSTSDITLSESIFNFKWLYYCGGQGSTSATTDQAFDSRTFRTTDLSGNKVIGLQDDSGYAWWTVSTDGVTLTKGNGTAYNMGQIIGIGRK